MRIITACFILAFPMILFGQNSLSKVVQLSGIIQAKDSRQPVPFATIAVVGTARGVIADENGFYSLPVKPFELLSITAVGFVKVDFSIPESEDKKLIINHLMPTDTIELPEAVVYPWPKKKYLKEEFMAINVKDDLKVKIQKNLTELQHILKKELEKPTQLSGGAAQNELNALISKNYYQGQTHPDHLKILNPIAWVQFIQELKKKAKKKK